MSQRLKARQFVKREGHGSELRGISTRVAPKTPTAPQFPNQALDGGMTSPDTGLGMSGAPQAAPDPAGMPGGLRGGGRAC